MLFNKIKYLIIDVDGTLTDAGIYYDEHGNEMKKFSTRDATGIFAAHAIGIQVMILTGRECAATTRRMQELKVDYLYQNVKNKKVFLQDFMEKQQIAGEQIGYIGDDLNDLPAMGLAGFVACPADGCLEIQQKADYVSTKKGGDGAVREVIEHMMREDGTWDAAMNKIFGGV